MAKFDYRLSEDEDQACVRMEDIFDIHTLRTEEGLVIDLYGEEQP